MTSLTPALYERLTSLEKTNHTIDQRYPYNRQTMADYRTLASDGYCSEGETGPGGSVAIFSITAKGREALAAYRSGRD